MLTFCARPAFGHRQPQPILDERGESAPLRSGLAFGALEQILRESDGGSLGHICHDILLCRLYVNGGAIDPPIWRIEELTPALSVKYYLTYVKVHFT